MKKKMLYVIIFFVMIIVIIGGGYIFSISHFTLSKYIIGISSVEISSKSVNISGDIASSAIWVTGYKTRYQNETLYIRLLGGYINYNHFKGGINFSIPNTFGNIKAVHIEDAQGGDVVVWPDNKTLRHTPQ